MRHGTDFNLDGIWASDMGIIKVNIGGGLIEDLLVSSKTIIEEKIEGRDSPYFYGVERQPLSFPLPIYFDKNLSVDKVREILRWLDHDTYKPFYMKDNPERVWYVMIVDDIKTIHNGIKSGYIELNLRTDSPHTQTPYVMSGMFSFRDNANGKEIEFENIGDFEIKPNVYIAKVGNGDITIKNFSSESGEFKFTNLEDGETLFIDCENKYIESSKGKYRYDDFSNKYLSFVCGLNFLQVIGDCDIRFETEFKVY